MNANLNDFCKCEKRSGQYLKVVKFGTWFICCDCERYIDDSFEYYKPKSNMEHISED